MLIDLPPSIPGRKPPSPEQDEIPDDGSIARATYYGPYSTNIYWDIHSLNEIPLHETIMYGIEPIHVRTTYADFSYIV